MPRTKISEFSATPGNNTDIDGINLAEGCAPSGINDAIRELMAQLKDFQAGTAGDSFNGPVGTTTPAAGAFTTLSASSTTTLSGLTASTSLALDASKNVTSVTNTGTGNNVLATSPTLVTPNLGTPSAVTLTNATGLPISTGVTGMAAGAATFLVTPSSANLASLVTDETGTGALVFAGSPTFTGTVSGAALTLSSSLTLNGGTANGVAYLNGSKVLTSGSALTFDGTSLAVGGVPTVQGELNVFKTGAAPTLYVQGDTGNSTTQGIIRIGGSVGRSASIQGFREASSNLQALRFYSYNSADQLNYEITSGGTSIWSVSGSEQMRLTSTGLGIGTSSPIYDLQVGSYGVDADSTLALASTTTGTGSIRFGDGTSGTDANAGLLRYDHSNNSMLFWTTATERARITGAGSFVVGTAAIATNATDGFLYVPTCAGTPTGTPTTQTGTAPIVIDTTNNKLYFYSGGQWRDAGP